MCVCVCLPVLELLQGSLSVCRTPVTGCNWVDCVVGPLLFVVLSMQTPLAIMYCQCALLSDESVTFDS